MIGYEVCQGAARTICFVIADSDGNIIGNYAGTEALATSVWPGGNQPAVITPSTAWANQPPTDGQVVVTINAADTTGLAMGRYQVQTVLTPIGGDPVPVLRAVLDVLETPGTAAPRGSRLVPAVGISRFRSATNIVPERAT